ncbi:hypothetical protein JCM5296_001029 [Sporobolomyces johnsonii]
MSMSMSRWSDASPDIVARPPGNFEAFFASLGASLAHARPLTAVLPNDEGRSSTHIAPTFLDSVLSCFKASTTTSLQSHLSLPLSLREPRSLDLYPSYGRKLMLPMMLARREECREELDEMSGKEPVTWRPNGRHGLSSRPDSTPTTAFVEPKDFFSASSASRGGDDAHHLPASDSTPTPTPDVGDPHDEPLIEPFPRRRPLVHRRHRSDHGPRHDLRRTVLKRRLTAPSSLSAPPRTMEGHLSGPTPRRAPSAEERLTRLPPPPPPLTDSGRAALELTEPDPDPAPSTRLAAVHFFRPEEPRCSIPSSSSSPSTDTVDGERSRFSDSDSDSDHSSDLDYDSDDDCDEDEGAAEAQEEEGEEDDDSKDAKGVQRPDGRSSPSTTR